MATPALSASATVDFPNPTQLAAITSPAPVTIPFSAEGSGGTEPYAFSWDFGDGTNATGASVSHAYDTPGDYSVVLDVTDATGTTASLTIPLVITGVPVPPTFSITLNADPTSGPAPLKVAFSTSLHGGVAPFTYLLEFGDGNHTSTGGTGSNVHKYASKGTYAATMTAKDSTGATAKSSVTISVS